MAGVVDEDEIVLGGPVEHLIDFEVDLVERAIDQIENLEAPQLGRFQHLFEAGDVVFGAAQRRELGLFGEFSVADQDRVARAAHAWDSTSC